MSRRIKILINASTSSISGGLIVATDYIHHLVSVNNYEIVIISPKLRLYEQFNSKNTHLYVPNFSLHKIFRWYLEYFWLPTEIKKTRPDIVLTLSNLPARTYIPQIFLHQNPYITYDNWAEISMPFSTWVFQRLRKYFFKKRLRFVDQIIVQTEYEKSQLESTISFNKPIIVLQPFLPNHLLNELPSLRKIELPSDKHIRLIFPSRYFEHKNFMLLIDTAKIIQNKKLSIQIILTLSKNQGKATKKIIREIKQYSEVIRNIGQIIPEVIPSIIKQCDYVVVPSLIETYGLNCIEAWFLKKPLLISDRKYARRNCGNAAEYFDPRDPNDLLNKIILLQSNYESRISLIWNGEERISGLSKTKDLISIIDVFCKQCNISF